ncbi:MAG: aromatic hydrocarbon degradation protein [Spirochaetaceae bacterium]|nr:aromatic hydrocarbon degradation protein [Spirochaetaceae bacterium]|tara:strand:- start:173506 stop:174933 length:1428 start_codon:yes stop_codon:yes gene_type:complete
MTFRNTFGLPVLGMLLLCSDAFAGNFADVYGAHPYATGMGNAVSSFINDSSATYYNPAGLGLPSRGNQLYHYMESRNAESPEPDAGDSGRFSNIWSDTQQIFANSLTNSPKTRSQANPHELVLQYNYAKPAIKTNAPNNSDIEGIQDHYAGLGLTLDLNNIYDLDRGLRFGLNMILPGSGNLATVNDLNPTVHRYLQRGVSNDRPLIFGGLGVELWKDHLYFGVGFTALIKGQGAILLKDVPISPDPVTPNQQVILELKPQANETLGLMFHWGKFRLGASFRRETFLFVDPLTARAQTTLLGIQFDFDLAVLDLYHPRTFTYAFAYQASENLLISVDVSRELWSKYGLSRTKERFFTPYYLEDISVPKLGVEYRWNESWSFRLGYMRRPSPLPVDLPEEVNWMDSSTVSYMAGVSYAFLPALDSNLKSPILIDLSLQTQSIKPRTELKANPTTQNPIYDYGGSAFHAGLSITLYL